MASSNAQPVRLELLGQGGELQLGARGVGELPQQRHVVAGPLPGGPAVGREDTDRRAVEHDAAVRRGRRRPGRRRPARGPTAAGRGGCPGRRAARRRSPARPRRAIRPAVPAGRGPRSGGPRRPPPSPRRRRGRPRPVGTEQPYREAGQPLEALRAQRGRLEPPDRFHPPVARARWDGGAHGVLPSTRRHGTRPDAPDSRILVSYAGTGLRTGAEGRTERSRRAQRPAA